MFLTHYRLLMNSSPDHVLACIREPASLMGQKRWSAFPVILSSHITLIMWVFFSFLKSLLHLYLLKRFSSNAEDSIEDEIEMRKRAGINDNWAVFLKAGQMKCVFCFHPVRYDAFITHRVGKILKELFQRCASIVIDYRWDSSWEVKQCALLSNKALFFI